jgi:hypothetical protein
LWKVAEAAFGVGVFLGVIMGIAALTFYVRQAKEFGSNKEDMR